jgi:phosphoserine phosphatase
MAEALYMRNTPMNVYDFDNTIYEGDSTVDFYLSCLRRYPALWARLPLLGIHGLMFLTGTIHKTQFKERFFGFLHHIPNVQQEVEHFWDGHEKKIKRWYRDQRREDDVIISASPEFLLRPIIERLGGGVLIVSRVNASSGRFSGLNCYGSEKVVRFYERYPDCNVEGFYSDSLSDAPMAALAKQAYLVKGDHMEPWPKQSV